jgi:CelD/BcsL family acetyltransferase involved in cellulose biosynthesis
MYSKPFEQPCPVYDRTAKDRRNQPRQPVILARLSDSDQPVQNGAGKIGKNQQNSAFSKHDSLEVFTDFDAVRKIWKRFEQQAPCFIYQTFGWCESWYSSIGAKQGFRPHIVAVRNLTGELVMLVPLCLKADQFGTGLYFIGEGISDYLAPLLQEDYAKELDATEFKVLWREILTSVDEKIDLLWFDRQPLCIFDNENPFKHLPNFAYPSRSHMLNFPEAKNWFEGARIVRSKKTAKKIERRMRQMAKTGKVELLEITGTENRRRHFYELLKLKIENLNDAGTLHKMDKPEIADYYSALVTNRETQDAMCQFELRCGGKLVASVFGLIHQETFFYQVCAFNKKEFGQYSPGLLLLYQLFDWSFARGLKHFDMTIGDEAYKADWANQTTALVVVAKPLSLRGHLSLAKKRTIIAVKEFIKNTPFLRRQVMKIVQKKAA